jgi:hypothetical protein
MELSPPALLTILSSTFFTTSLPNQPSTTSDILSILPLCHDQPSTMPTSSADHIPPPAPQSIYPSPVPQITYPGPTNDPQIKNEVNLPPQPPPQNQEHQQQSEAFPTHGTILTITGGSNTNFNSKLQHQDYYREVNHVAIERSITQIRWSHIPITFSVQDVNLTLFPHTDTMVLTVHIDR